MEFYRFPPAHPRRLFLAVIAFVTVVLALPTIVQAALADPSADVEQVTLTEPSQDWEIDVPDLYCERDYESLASIGWTCGDVSVQATLTEDAKDDATTLRRMVRALAMTSLPADAPTFDGTNGALLLADAPSSTAALSLDGTGEDETKDWVVTVTGKGDQAQATASRIWHAFGQEELPADAEAEFADFSGELMY